jgi:hypothetical protein
LRHSHTPPFARDAHIYKRALSLGVAGLVAVLVLVGWGVDLVGSRGSLRRGVSLRLSPKVVAAAQLPRLTAEPLTSALRAKGYHECNPHDPIGLGPYAPYRNVAFGHLLVPQRGGHTSDGGYDLMLHFHGREAVRKTLVQVARGVAYVGIDKGLASGPYEQAFACADVFPALLTSIEKGLKAQTGDSRAHIRHLALTAWSAGYGAVNEILRRHAQRVDAVVLLDGLHGSWDAKPNRDSAKPLRSTSIAPTIEFARRALRGEKIFVFTHSQVDPVEYTSTAETADLLLVEFGLSRQRVAPSLYDFGQDSRVDARGFHVWSYRGGNEHAHCAHIPLIAKALDIIEPAWQTPAMDRAVPFTAVKRWPKRELPGAADSTLAAALRDEPESGAEIE